MGVGIRTIQDADGNMEIVEVLPQSAAEKAGLKKGDVILEIDGKEVIRITYGEALSYLDGAAGTQVTFQVLRTETAETEEDGKTTSEEVSKTMDFSITRSEYESNSVVWKVINGNVGCLTIRSFTNDTAEEVKDALEELQKAEVCGLIIDVRGNTEGTVEQMVEACRPILPAGNVARYVDTNGDTISEASSGGGKLNVPMAVLIDDTTYGASEVLAAAIRDGKAGILVGTETAGGASRQDTIQLSDGSALILTVGYYVDAQGNSLYGSGVLPDREVELSVLQKQVLMRELLDVREDPQMQTAVTALIENGAAVQEVPGSSSSVS